MQLTRFLFEDGSQDNRGVDCLFVKRHIVCALHMVDPKLLVHWREVVDADVWCGAWVQSAGWTITEESCTEAPAMAFWHGHIPHRSLDDFFNTVGMVSLWAMALFELWGWWVVGW